MYYDKMYHCFQRQFLIISNMCFSIIRLRNLFYFVFQTPCCNKFYMCRYCHDENEQHYFNRKTVTELICTECDTRQKVQAECEKCGVRFGKVKPFFFIFCRYTVCLYFSLIRLLNIFQDWFLC